MEEEEEAAAEICAPKRRRSARLSGQQVSPGGDSGSDSGGGGGSDGQGNLDFVSGLPDEVLGTVISLLPTKDGARTQVLSRRWQPLWLSPMAPLNISANCRLGNNQSCVALVSKILSNHPGPARRFSARIASPWDFRSKVAHWLRSETLTGLQELEVSNMQIKPYPLPPHVLTRFAPTLRVLQLSGCCGFRLRSALPSFPHLKRLILFDVDISEDSLQFVISSCAVLERVSLRDVIFGRLCISSRTLRSIDIHTLGSEGGELVIEDAPCLERLLPDFPKDGPATIRVIEAPKLKILGSLPKHIRVIHCGANHGRGCGA